MKKAFVAMVLAMAVAAVAHAGTIALVPSALTVAVGATFTVDVVVTSVDGAEVLDVQVSFDPTLVHALGASEGEYMAQQNPDFPMPFGNLFDNTNGLLSYTITRLGPNVSTGSGTAATLTFECQAQGVTTLDYAVALSDQAGATIASGTGSVDVQQGEGGVVPEPMTLALVGAALTALGVVARKRS